MIKRLQHSLRDEKKRIKIKGQIQPTKSLQRQEPTEDARSNSDRITVSGRCFTSVKLSGGITARDYGRGKAEVSQQISLSQLPKQSATSQLPGETRWNRNARCQQSQRLAPARSSRVLTRGTTLLLWYACSKTCCESRPPSSPPPSESIHGGCYSETAFHCSSWCEMSFQE